MSEITPAHDGHISHSYTIHYPDHFPRKSDPHYKDFNHFKRTMVPNGRCAEAVHHDLPGDPAPVRVGKRLIGAGETRAECDTDHPLEVHHAIIEFSLQNGIDLAILEKDYPGISDPTTVGAWVESAQNLEILCVHHHRSHAGKHTAAFADYVAAKYVKGLIS